MILAIRNERLAKYSTSQIFLKLSPQVGKDYTILFSLGLAESTLSSGNACNTLGILASELMEFPVIIDKIHVLYRKISINYMWP